VKTRGKASFDPKAFLAKVGEGKTISKYPKDQTVFSQGEIADAVFYIQKGKIKLTVVSEQGKEAVVNRGALRFRACRNYAVSVVTQRHQGIERHASQARCPRPFRPPSTST
jgi:CRP-like cAMP-binding protein